MKAIMEKHVKKTTALLLCAICATMSIFGLLSLSASGATTLDGHGVAGLTATYEDSSHSSATSIQNWSATTNGVSWENTTTKTGWISKKYYYKASTLTLTNDSSTAKVLSFEYTVTVGGGQVSIDGSNVTTSGKFSKTLGVGESVTVYAKTSATTEGTTSVSITGMTLSVNNVTVTFATPENGVYTVDGTKITSETSKTDLSTKNYTLVATPNENFVFSGWYIGEQLLSAEKSWTGSFSTTCTVAAKFSLDPLYVATIVSSESTYSKEQLLTVSSRYYHDGTAKLVSPGSMPTNQSAYSVTSVTAVKDKIDVQYVPSLQWEVNTTGATSSIKVSYSATATGDYVSSFAERSTAYARVHSDIIRVYVKKNCNISFDYTNSMTGGGTNTSTLYYYISSSPTATIAQVKTGEKLTASSGSSGAIALTEGYYLYILTEGYTTKEQLMTPPSISFNYSASISNFTVSYNDVKYTLDAGFRDNTGKLLATGSLTINNTAYSIGSNGNVSQMEFAELSEVKLQVGTAPKGYVHIGWALTENGEIEYLYEETYTHTFESDCIVHALFVPKMTISMGTNGYSDATYELFDGSPHNGEYVARDANSTNFYASLAEAFEATDVVVLLAGNTINGNWTIPANKTLVIPFSLVDRASADPIATTSTILSAYCQVTINGNVTVNGSLLVSSKQYQSTGTPGGRTGHLILGADANVTVNGTFYSFGPVTGDGHIIVNNGATVHELVEIQGNRGPLGMNNIYEARGQRKVFPVTALYFKNIESAVTYHKGAQLIGHAALTYDKVSQAPFNIIGTGGNALLNINSGTVTKYFDYNAGQMVFRVDEGSDAATGDFSIELSASVYTQSVDITLSSADYYIPLNSCFRFETAGKLTINGNYKFLPGATLKVLDSGVVIVSEKANLFFYRMNDFDNRGTHANSTDQWGYTSTAYPANPTRFPGVTYMFIFNANNVGSAKLHVDGELIVYGGLYVTNDLQTDTENGIVIRDNGYNYLTGYGTIDVTEANTNLTIVYEAMAAAGTNDIKWDEVSIVPMKGLKKDATADEAAQYESLTGVMSGVLNSNELNVWLSGAPELNVAYRLDDYLWFNGYFLGANINEISEGIDMVPLEKDGVITTYIVKAIAAAEIPNDLVFTITFTLDDAQYTRQFTVNLATYDAGDDEALKQALLNYGEAAEDHFVAKNDQTANVTKPDDIPTETTPFVPQVDGVSLGNVTVTRYGMTIGFDNCLQFIYGFNVSGLTTVTENGVQYLQNASGVKVAEIGLLYSTAAGELVAQKSSYAYVLYQNPALTADSGNLPEGVTPTNKPTDSTLTPSELATMLEKNDCYMITYDMKFVDYGTSCNYRLYVLFEDGSVAYGDQFAYSLETYIGNRLGSTNPPPNDTETTLLYATWDLRTAVATWLSAKGAQN